LTVFYFQYLTHILPQFDIFEFSSSNVLFDHGSKVEIIDIDNKKLKGNPGGIEWMFALFDPNEVSVSDSLIELILNYSLEGLEQRISKDEKFVTYDNMKTHMKNFKNKRKDSNDFKEAVKVIQDFYSPKNIKVIDQ